MRTNSISCFVFLISLFLLSCKTYKSIEKAADLSNPPLSKIESIAKQLASLEVGDRISITMENEASHDLIYLAVDSDSLSAKLQKPKISQPMKIALNRIQRVKVERLDVALTATLSALTAGLFTIMIIHQLNNMVIF